MSEIAEGLDVVAAEAAAFEATSAAPVAVPGEPSAPVVDPAQEWRDAAHMGCGLVMAMRPELKAEWTADKLDALGAALHKCAERYGWTVASFFGHPLVGMAFAVFPLAASLVRIERARAEKKQAEQPQPAQPGAANDGGSVVTLYPGNLTPAT